MSSRGGILMKFKHLMTIKAVICLFFGVLLVVLPEELLSILGITVGVGGIFMARLYGASLIGNLMLTWFGRNAEESATKRAIILDLFAYDAVGLVVAFIAQIGGLMNPLGWFIVFIYFFLTIGFGYFLMAKRSPA